MKANYGSRKNYSIETAALEKRLVFDSSMISLENTIYAFADLKAHYDCKLLKLGSMIEEVLVRDRNAMFMFAKTLPILQRHTCTRCRISENWHGGTSSKLAETG